MFPSTALCQTSTACLSDLQQSDTQIEIKNCLEKKKRTRSRGQTLSQTAASMEACEMKSAFATDVCLL